MKSRASVFFSYSAVILVFLLSGFGIFSWSSASVPPSVTAYLSQVSPQTDWTVMALSALGQDAGDTSFLKQVDGATANDYATYILAITALGKDPRAYGNENFVYKLEQTASNGQIGSQSLVNDDMFGVLALRSAGVSADDALIKSAVEYIKNNQLNDGSWDFAASSNTGSADMTAAGILALLSAGVSKTDSQILLARDFLANMQAEDGGFPIMSGEAPNTESTAWALSAIYALGESPSSWQPQQKSPIDYLNARLHLDGYFLFNEAAQTSDLRTPTTSSYAAIALQGKFYPVNSITAPISSSLRIEGALSTLCLITAEGKTALDVVKSAASECGYTYVIEDTQYGPYLTTINNEAAEGMLGWNYRVNSESAFVGAGDYALSQGDKVVWYYGDWDSAMLRLTHAETTVGVGDSTVALVEAYVDGAWQAKLGITVKRGAETFVTDANGQVSLSWPLAGVYSLSAQAEGYVRSNSIAVAAGNGGAQASLPLAVNVQAGGSTPPGDPGNPALIFGVTGDLDFGALAAGQTSTKVAVIANNGTTPIKTTATVGGAQLFVDNISLDNSLVSDWEKQVQELSTSEVSVRLSVPVAYSATGKENGTLIFWASPVE